ncbi:hypothetical protein MUP77_12290 [Candidatus Bathyarchaeota archaeon]|nr:hypothetical protein [Candidatus Bathyarchaeota archaeon]
MDRDSISPSYWDLQSRSTYQSEKDVYLFNERAAITFSYHPELYNTHHGSFSRLSGAEVYVGAIWNYLVWQRPDICFFEEELRDEILAMLVTTTISHEITHELIDEIEPSHLAKADFEEKILNEVDAAYQKSFSGRIRKHD